MKSSRVLTAIVLVLGLSLKAGAQTNIENMVKDWERAKAYTKEYLDVMPAEKYDLKPTPEMRSFAGQMMHLADANFGFAAVAGGVKAPSGFGDLEKSTDMSKATVTAKVMESYDFMINTLKNMKPAQMGEMVKLFDRFDLTRAAAFAKSFEHQTHHRGQTTVYIRLAGAKPPQEKLF